MIPFLKSLAAAYAARYNDMSSLLFLFPNKRSGTFFLKHLGDVIGGGKPRIAPQVMTISDFATSVSGLFVAPRIDQLFRLYQAYIDVAARMGATPMEFDRFRSIGDVILSDFSEIDQYGVNAEEIFSNIEDFREITSDFLTEEQKEVMSRYFGRTLTHEGVAGFWKNFGKDKMSDSKRRYLYLWQMLLPLYREFSASLKRDGLATQGGVYRAAYNRLKAERGSVVPARHVVVAGFNALTTMEIEIFKILNSLRDENDLKVVDFFWDGTGGILGRDAKTLDGVDSAARFLKVNRSLFPSPEWASAAMKHSETVGFADEINIVASPGNAQQAKIAGRIIKQLREELPEDEFKSARVAVVLPDEGLLLPLLYGLPEHTDVNLTMGYNLRLTSVVTFVRLLSDCYFHRRDMHGEPAYFHESVRRLLAHPYCNLLESAEIVSKVLDDIDKHHLYSVSVGFLQSHSQLLADLLTPFSDKASPKEVIARLDKVLEQLEQSLESNDGYVKERLDREYIEVYRQALQRLADAVHQYGVSMKPVTLFAMAQRLIAGETVSFNGEPLTGLQVMGMLETRALDFDYLVVCSLNERVVPLRRRKRTFIPDALRCGYVMPPSGYEESIFSYYFYRMISRAKKVWLLYDARSSSGMRSGGVSRYVLQLRHLERCGALGNTKINEVEYVWETVRHENNEHVVAKTKQTNEMLELFTKPDSGYNFSASTLRNYMMCPVRFYYENIIRLPEPPSAVEYIDAIMQGTILHDLILNLYLSPNKRKIYLEKPQIITTEFLKNKMADVEAIYKETVRITNLKHHKLSFEDCDRELTGADRMVAEMIVRQALTIMKHDLELTPFELYGCEIADTISMNVAGRTINMKFAIDRLDRIEINGEKILRIVDYKTGRVHLEAEEFENIFNGDYRAGNIFQLMLYSRVLNEAGYKLPHSKEGEPEKVRMEIYDVNKLDKGEESLPVVAGCVIDNHLQTASEFDDRFEKLIVELYDCDEFKCVDESNCSLCRMRSICRR